MIKNIKNRRKGRPPKFVLNPNGRPIVGLSYSKSNKSYYATYSKPRLRYSIAYLIIVLTTENF